MQTNSMKKALSNNWKMIALVCVIAYMMYNYCNYESFDNLVVKEQQVGPEPGNPQPNDDEDTSEYAKVGDNQEIALPSCAQFVSSNLLPKDDPKLDNTFTEFSPANDLEGQSFIDTNKYAIGMQSETLRNANYQLRSDPPISNTMECSSPWNNTTISAESRRPLNIGSTC